MTTTPAEWIFQMQQPADVSRAFIAKTTRVYLTKNLKPGAHLLTAELAEELWRSAHALGEAIGLRKKMVDTLLKCATNELTDCAYKSEQRKQKLFMGKPVYPWIWHAPSPDAVRVIPGEGHTHRAANLTPEETRMKLIDVIRLSPPAQNLPALYINQIADTILTRAKVSFV